MDGYYAFMLVATALVLMMTVPALALFYGGMSRSKSVLNMMMMSYVAVGLVGLVYVLWGWSMTFGSDDVGGLFASPFELFGLSGVASDGYVAVMFQMTFAAITAALISGAIADRVRLAAWILFVPLWVTLSYFPIGHMVWVAASSPSTSPRRTTRAARSCTSTPGSPPSCWCWWSVAGSASAGSRCGRTT